MSSRCIIIGAGASYGYDNSLLEQEKPPLVMDFLSRSVRIGALSDWKYPMLFNALVDYTHSYGKDVYFFSDVDIEDFSLYLRDQINRISGFVNSAFGYPRIPENLETEKSSIERLFFNSLSIIRNDTQKSENQISDFDRLIKRLKKALGELSYLIFEVLKKYSVAYRPHYDAYQRLALSHYKENYSLISLNYDVIFEAAALSVGMKPVYVHQDIKNDDVSLQFIDPRSTIRLIKPHGSINWFKEIRMPPTSLDNSRNRGYKLLQFSSGRIWRRETLHDIPFFVPPSQLSSIDIQDLLMANTEVYTPSVSLLEREYVDGPPSTYLESNWKAVLESVSSASEIIIIGYKIRFIDRNLERLIRLYANKNVNVTVVGSRETKTGIEELLGHKINDLAFYRDFEDYSRQL